MSWNKIQISQHKQAGRLLDKIIVDVANFIGKNSDTTDVAVRQFIRKQYQKYNLKSDREKSICAFGKNTSFVHFFADKPDRLRENSLILIDIWARLNEPGAPFADITWMVYLGKNMPAEYEEIFQIVAGARDEAVKFLKKNLQKKIIPTGKEVDLIVKKYLDKHGHLDKFLHGTGHSLGFKSAHGNRTHINRKGRQALPLNVGYTIEPGVYFKNKFGVRSEIDFYIDENYKLTITTKVQKKIIKINL